MALFELFSKRRRRERGDFPDVYSYDGIPSPLRVQIVHIVREIYFQGNSLTDHARSILIQIDQVLCREYGVFHLVDQYHQHFDSLANFILKEKDHEKVLDATEILFQYADNSIRENSFYFNRKINVDDAISELNSRFKEAGIGYQFESGNIIRVDSELLHSEAVKPILMLLRKKPFKTVNQEFLSAHENYCMEDTMPVSLMLTRALKVCSRLFAHRKDGVSTKKIRQRSL